jgi:hypothetical protein
MSGGANKRARRHGMAGSGGVESEGDVALRQSNTVVEDDEMASVSSASTALTTFSGEDERKRELVRLMMQCMHNMGFQYALLSAIALRRSVAHGNGNCFFFFFFFFFFFSVALQVHLSANLVCNCNANSLINLCTPLSLAIGRPPNDVSPICNPCLPLLTPCFGFANRDFWNFSMPICLISPRRLRSCARISPRSMSFRLRRDFISSRRLCSLPTLPSFVLASPVSCLAMVPVLVFPIQLPLLLPMLHRRTTILL